MKKLSLWLLIFAFATSLAHAQDSATQAQIDQINGRIQDLDTALELQKKSISALEKEIADLQNKLNQPATNNYATVDDLKQLATQVQEIDKKRQKDNERILKELERLEKSLGAPTSSHREATVLSKELATENSTENAGGAPQKGYNYTIQSGDTLLAIAKAYRSQMHIKVTVDDILKANPGLNPKGLKVGQKIFIPAPGQ